MQRAALARTTVLLAIMISDIRFKDFEDALATAGSLADAAERMGRCAARVFDVAI